MEFGKTENLDEIDFSLPPVPPLTLEVLRKEKSKGAKDAKIYCGCAKWGRKEWIGKLYPLGTKEKDFLQHYQKLQLY
jgi:hypothetical protein